VWARGEQRRKWRGSHETPRVACGELACVPASSAGSPGLRRAVSLSSPLPHARPTRASETEAVRTLGAVSGEEAVRELDIIAMPPLHGRPAVDGRALSAPPPHALHR
jgi:hypothetical protein